jgi:hypothetical protein
MIMHKKLVDLYYKNGTVFIMAISHLLSIGINNAAKITDEQIEKVEGNGLMTQLFCQEIVRLAREIAKIVENDPIRLIQFCMVEELFDTEFYKVENGVKIVYDPDFGDNRKCKCGHAYARHFDPYENWEFVGCKYCGCDNFVEADEEE